MSPASRNPNSVVLSHDDRHYFACELTSLVTLSVLGLEETQYLPAHRQHHVDFLTCLINPSDARYTYDLRIISDPDPEVYTRGRLTVAILGRIDGGGAEAAAVHARQFLRLLASSFDEYEFELAEPDRVSHLLAPFEITGLAAITRRSTRATLDTLIRREAKAKPRGFTNPGTPSYGPVAPDILHIFPYIPTSRPFDGFCKLLLLEPAPIAVSCRLQPSRMTAEEEAFLEGQIAACEGYAQAQIGAIPDDIASLRPTLHEHARDHQRYLSRMLEGLRDNATLLTVEIASSEPISSHVVNVLGNLITQPAGGIEPSPEQGSAAYLAGGYEVQALDDVAGRSRAFYQMDLAPLVRASSRPDLHRLVSLFDSIEAAAAFRLPPAGEEPLPGIASRQWRLESPPANLPAEGVVIGTSAGMGTQQLVRIGRDDRRRHLYVVGQTGTGKTTLLKTMILDDMRSGQGLCVIDPHGDLYRELLCNVPPERADDVVLLDPTDLEHPVGLNMLEYETEAQRYFLVQEMVAIITRIMEDEYGAAAPHMMGPIFLQHMRMNLLLIMSNAADPGTLLEFYTIYQEKGYWKRWLPLRVSDPQLDRWVSNVLPSTDYTTPTNEGVSMGGYVGSKFEGFVFDPMLRNIFGQKHTTIDIRGIMDSGKILLVNLAKGELTETNSRFLGMVLLAKIQAAAMARSTIPQAERRDFSVYADEFQSIATQNFITLLSEARKFGLNLTLANQFVSQIRDERISQSIFGNVGSLICFRLGQRDAEIMEREMFPVFTRSDLINLPNWHAYMTTLIDGQTVQPFTIQTMTVDGTPDPSRAQRIRELSRAKYARSRECVAKEIMKSVGSGREA